MTNIKLPRDAEGREIPLNTNTLYDADGDKREVQAFEFSVIHGTWKVQFVGNLLFLHTSSMHLIEPDSWAKLEEDLDRCIKGSSLCAYYRTSGSCYDCTIFDDNSEVCDSRALRDIKDRIRKLRGKGDA